MGGAGGAAWVVLALFVGGGGGERWKMVAESKSESSRVELDLLMALSGCQDCMCREG